MTEQLIGTLAGGAMQSVGSIASSLINAKQAAKQRDWSEKMLDKQNQFSEDMWNKTNEYNSASSQIQRLKDAGLNPLFYGLDGSNASSFTSAQALNAERANVDNPFSGYAQIGADVGLKIAQAKNIEADTQKKVSETQGQEIQNWVNEHSKSEQVEMFGVQIGELKARTAKEQADKDLALGQLKKAEQDIEASKADIQLRTQDMSRKQLEYELNVRKFEFQKSIDYWHMDNESKRLANDIWKDSIDSVLTLDQADKVKEETKKTKAETANVQTQGEMLSKENNAKDQKYYDKDAKIELRGKRAKNFETTTNGVKNLAATAEIATEAAINVVKIGTGTAAFTPTYNTTNQIYNPTYYKTVKQ
ncbi:minor capsid protein [Capybara microvirus Cap1_SP_107]|nr:minor capsid protein [Capybara microvirus Cap1_SP_107]